ncbi:MAG: hypothetical protein J5527_07900 [Treponema sp.]|nr:hypothetical protein [Treponema sp.]
MKRTFFRKNIAVFAVCFALLLCGTLFSGCTSEIGISLNKDGTIDVRFEGASGVAFATLIRSAAGVEEGDVVFDTREIIAELSKNSFSEVRAISKKGTDLIITMKDKQQTTPLFTSGVLKVKGGKLSATLSADRLLNFYKSSDEEIVSFLDMLLAPVFNDEVLSVVEYLDTIASFYGADAAKEIEESQFKITLKDADGTSRVFTIPMTTLLTLNEVIEM